MSEVRLHHRDLPEGAVGEQLADDVDVGEIARPHRFHREHLRRCGSIGDLLRLPSSDCDRLLDEHVFASLDRKQCVLEMELVCGRDINDIDVGITDELFVARVRLVDTASGCERFTLARRPRRHGSDALRGVLMGAVDECLGDRTGTKHTPAQLRDTVRIDDARCGE